jgi:hypothetical protein
VPVDRRSCKGPDAANWCEAIIPIHWPEEARASKLSLLLGEHEVTEINLKRPITATGLNKVLDGYFDPSHETLRKWLFTKTKHSRQFEKAVVRLLNLLGIAAIWYGEGAEARKSDLATIIEDPSRHDKPTVLLGECTQENPRGKFSTLRERAQDLQRLVGEKVKVVPLVFTQSAPVPSDIEAANEHGITLVGRERVQALFDLLMTNGTKQDALRILGSVSDEM